MAASGYITELDFESIWGRQIETARFTKINVRLGEILNFLITRDASTDITDTTILPMIEQFAEESLILILQASKSDKFSDVWKFIQSGAGNIVRHVLSVNKEILEMIELKLGKRWHYTETDKYSYSDVGVGMIRRSHDG